MCLGVGVADYRSLEVWKRAYDLTLEVYRITRAYPNNETFGLAAQTRRAMTSLPANIAEGAGRASNRDYARFVAIAIGSSNEVEVELGLAKDLGYLGVEDWTALEAELSQIRSMLTRLRRHLLATVRPRDD